MAEVLPDADLPLAPAVAFLAVEADELVLADLADPPFLVPPFPAADLELAPFERVLEPEVPAGLLLEPAEPEVFADFDPPVFAEADLVDPFLPEVDFVPLVFEAVDLVVEPAFVEADLVPLVFGAADLLFEAVFEADFVPLVFGAADLLVEPVFEADFVPPTLLAAAFFVGADLAERAVDPPVEALVLDAVPDLEALDFVAAVFFDPDAEDADFDRPAVEPPDVFPDDFFAGLLAEAVPPACLTTAEAVPIAAPVAAPAAALCRISPTTSLALS